MLVDQSQLASGLKKLFLQLRPAIIVAPALAVIFTITSLTAGAQRRPIEGRKPILRGQPGSFVTGDALVVLKDGVTEADMTKALNAVGVQVVKPLALKPYYLVRILPVGGVPPSDQATLDKVAELKKLTSIKHAQPNWRFVKFDTTPNDPRYKEQWHYPLINLPKAWDIAQGTSNVIVADTDTGADLTHPEFAGRQISTINYTASPPNNDVTDGDGHGTHTLGTITANTNNSVGVAGVTFGINPIFVGKIFDANGTTDQIIVDTIMYIADKVKTDQNFVVVNCSWGAYVTDDAPDLSDPTEAAIYYAATVRNVCFSISAGNGYDQGNPAASPARVSQLDSRIFCVGACGNQKEHSFYSESRPYTTISAPGGDDPSFADNSNEVLSTLPGSSYGYEQGTSMAAPHITGAIALLLGAGAQPDQVKAIITQTADPGGRSVPNPDFGYGVIDTFAAVVQAKSAISLVNPTDGGYVYGNVAIQIKAGDPSKYLKAQAQVDADPTVVATADKGVYVLYWDTRALDGNGAAKYPNGGHKLIVTVTTPSGPIKFVRNVKVDNPIAVITTPAANGYVTKVVSVVGTADGLRIPTYNLEYSLAATPNTWVSIAANQNVRITTGALADWDLKGIADGSATLRLRVKNPDGFEVSATNPVIVDQTQPSIPKNLVGVGTNVTATLTWSASTDAPPGQLAGYNVYRSRQSLTGYQKVTPTLLPTTGFVDTGLTNAFTYFYKVTAVDAAGNESAPTDIKDVTPNRNGTMSGQVIALDGTFLSGADVTVLQNGTPVANGNINTDSAGQFSFPGPPGFPKGTYDVRASDAGYVSQLITGVSIDVGRDALAQNFALAPQPTFPSGWTMFTLPYDFAGATLASVFSGGTVKYYDPTLGRYLDPSDPAFPKPRPGVGYWLLKSGTPLVTGAGVPDKPVAAVQIPIRKGWNLLGNPFQDPVHWVLGNLVVTRSDNGQQSTLNLATNLGWALDFAWGGTDGKTLLFDRGIVPGVIDTIPGYGAFWFFSGVDGTLSIAPPSIVNRSAKESANLWTVKLNARAGSDTGTAYIGVGGTHRLVPLPPQVTPSVRLLLGTDAGYAVDLRTNSAGTQTWDVTVDNVVDKSVTLTWPGAATLPRGWSLALIDKATGMRTSLRTSSGVTLPATRAAHKLQLELTRDILSDRVGITNLGINPGRGTAPPSITFTLGHDAQTTVSILKANGDAVRTLTSRAAKIGVNNLVWDTKDDQGRSVAPGVYLVQVRAIGDRGDQAKAVVPIIITR